MNLRAETVERQKARAAVRLRRSLLLIGVVFYFGNLLSASASAYSSAGFCKQNDVVRDYFAPLRLANNGGFPKSGRLSFGPPVLRIFPAEEHVVAIGHGGFEVQALSESSEGSRPLKWWVVSQLERIDKRGSTGKVVKWKRQYVATVGGFSRRTFGFSGRVSPGFYRATVEIQKERGTRLGRFQELFRALPARSDVKLATSSAAFSPGAAGYLKVENFGTLPVGYSTAYKMRNNSGEEIPVEGVSSNILLQVHPGYASPCVPFKVPMGIAPGRYEIGVEAGDSRKGLGVISTFVNID